MLMLRHALFFSCVIAAFAPPEAKRDVRELAADNAVYRRSDLLRYQDLLRLGFWEPSFHTRFLKEGIRLILDPGLRVIHHNRYSAREFIAQRFAHGHEFGLTRARMQSFLNRLLLVVLAPGIPFILMTRIVRASRRKPELRKQLKGAWIWLAIFTARMGRRGSFRLPCELTTSIRCSPTEIRVYTRLTKPPQSKDVAHSKLEMGPRLCQ